MPKRFPEPDFPAAEVEAAVGSTPLEWRRIESGGYGRVNAHWHIVLADGTTAFVKHALNEEAEDWLRKERRIYEEVRGGFLPGLRGAGEAGGRTFVALEDLSGASWPPPWSAERVDRVLRTLDELHATQPPSWLPRLEENHDVIVGWSAVEADPGLVLNTGVCTRAWLDAALPTLAAAVRGPVLAGDAFVHFDVRSDNLCFIGDRTLLVDWNLAAVGNAQFDTAFWLPSLRLEGGPEPWDVLPDAGAVAAAVAGFFAARAGLPPPAGAPTVREFQRAQLKVALVWGARELGLSRPTLPT